MKVFSSSRHYFAPLALSGVVNLSYAEDLNLAPIDVIADEEINQQAQEKSATLGPLGKRRIHDTPYSISTVQNDLIENQQLKSFKDIIRYLPSVQGDGARPQTRGLQGSVVQNSRLDGFNVVSTTDYPAEQLSGVEVLHGLAGSLYGPANPAGTFNMLSKRPTDFRRNRVSMGLGTGLSWLKTVDLSGPFDVSEKIKYRFNIADEQGHSYASGSKVRRQLVTLATDFQINENSTIETTLSHYDYLVKGLPGRFSVAAGVTLPNAPDATRSNLGQNYAGDDNTTDTVSVRFKHNLDDNWKIDIGALRQIADRESTAVTNTLIDNSGTYRTTASTTAASRFTINSYLANINGTLNTGAITHELSFGLTGFDWDSYNPVAGATHTLGTSTLDNLVNFPYPEYPDFTDRYQTANARQNTFIIADTITFSPQWSLMASGSESRITSDNYTLAGVHSSDEESGISTAGSLLFKPIKNLTFYLTYADSLQPGDSAPAGTVNAGNILSPYRSRMWELGSKWIFKGSNISLAAFQIKRPFAYTTSENIYAIAGQQRNRGVEFLIDGNLSRQLKIFGGVTWLDPKLLSTGNSNTEDTRIVGLPRITANFLTEYQFENIPGLTVNFNARYVGRRAIDTSNNNWVDSYHTFDVGGSFNTRLVNRETIFRLHITNIGNAHYWTNIVPGGLNGYTGSGQASATPAAPRMLQASIQVDL